MIAIIATLKVKEGTGPEFEQAFAKLIEQTRTETGNVFYHLVKSRVDGSYKVMELYTDEDALQAHRDQPKDVARTLAPFMDGRAEVELLDLIG